MKKIIKWKNKVIYQIFPRSFYDQNNDGNGDLQGIIAKLDYLVDLGVDAIWLCPIYDTDFVDAGYDVKNYFAIWEKFGTQADFQELAQKAKARNIDLIMDLVLNHVSSAHSWFKKACLDVNSVEHNYFIWKEKLDQKTRDAKSIFGGSAWEYEPHVKKYYFHLFAKEQVDLNWHHPDTINIMVEVINFWYGLGVRGFRFDAIKHIDKNFPEGIENDFSWGKNTGKILSNFKHLAFSDKPDAFIFGEASGITVEEAITYGTGEQKIASSFFNFAWWWIGWGETGRNGYDPNWDYQNFVKMMAPFQHNILVSPSLMTNFLSNHDTARAISRWGDENVFWKEAAKTLAMMLFSLKGIPTIYYGEEIGMLNPRFTKQSEFRDVDVFNSYQHLVKEQQIYSIEELTKYHNINSRDNCRTPMQWDDQVNSGFNQGTKPWIKVGFNYQNINVKKQENDPDSILNFYKKIIQLYKSEEYQAIFVDGTVSFELLNSGIFKVTRIYHQQKIAIYLNVTRHQKAIKLEPFLEILASSYNDGKKEFANLRPYESLILKLK